MGIGDGIAQAGAPGGAIIDGAVGGSPLKVREFTITDADLSFNSTSEQVNDPAGPLPARPAGRRARVRPLPRGARVGDRHRRPADAVRHLLAHAGLPPERARGGRDAHAGLAGNVAEARAGGSPLLRR